MNFPFGLYKDEEKNKYLLKSKQGELIATIALENPKNIDIIVFIRNAAHAFLFQKGILNDKIFDMDVKYYDLQGFRVKHN